MLVGSNLPDGSHPEAKVHLVDFESRRLIFVPQKLPARVGLKHFMEEIEVSGIAVSVQSLKIVALQKTLRYINLVLRHPKPSISWKHGDFVLRAHVGEHHSTRLDTGISGVMDLAL